MGAKAIKEADQNERDSSCGFVEIDEKKVAESKNMNAALLTMVGVRRHIVISVGLLVFLMITMLTVGFFLLYKPLPPKPLNSTSSPNSISLEVLHILENTSTAEFREMFTNNSVAAEQGDAEAQFHLGEMYENGHGVNQSSEEAVRWYSLAAEQGEASAQNSLGKMYNEGKGVNQSSEEAIKWYSLAAEQGEARAQNSLGWMYEYGNGVNQSYEEAAKWFKKAAEQGDVDAQSKFKEISKEHGILIH